MRTLAEDHIAGGVFMEGGRRWHRFGDWTPGSDNAPGRPSALLWLFLYQSMELSKMPSLNYRMSLLRASDLGKRALYHPDP